jgi:hypothetical protein
MRANFRRGANLIETGCHTASSRGQRRVVLEQFRIYYELLWLDTAHEVWLVVIPMICVASYCLLTTVARER